MKSGTKLGLQALAFVVLAGGGVAYAVHSTGFSPSDMEHLASLGPGRLLGLAALSLGVFMSDAVRYRTVASALGSPIGWRAALDTAIACLFFANVTPGGTMGAPAATYMLWRHGVPLAPSTLIAFFKSMVSTIALMVFAFGFLLAGKGPQLGAATIGLMTGVTGLLSLALVPVVMVRSRPEAALALAGWAQARLARLGLERASQGLVARVEDLIARMRLLPVSSLPGIAAANALYFVNFVGLLVLIARALGAAPLASTIGTSTVYLAFVYVAPTPGASGLAEGVGPGFFSALLPAAQALAAVLAFRAVTAWLQLLVGGAHLLFMGGGDAVSALLALRERGGSGRPPGD